MYTLLIAPSSKNYKNISYYIKLSFNLENMGFTRCKDGGG